jgi:hypothetical protein
MVPAMTIGADQEFAIEDMSTGVFASGFGQVGDGRSFSFQIRDAQLLVEVYRPRLLGPVPQEDDVVATSSRTLVDIDVTDERSLGAAVQDSVALAEPVGRGAHSG